MTVEPKLIDATELEEMRQDSSGEFLWSADSARALLAHIAAQAKRIEELEAALKHCDLIAFTGTQTAIVRGDEDGARRAALFREIRDTVRALTGSADPA